MNFYRYVIALIILNLLTIPDTIIAEQKMSIKIGSGSVSGTYYPFATSIAKLINKRLEIDAEGLSTGGSAKNNEDLLNKKLEMALMQNDVSFYAYEGLENIPHNDNLRAIGSLFAEDVHIVVREDSGIYTINDMIGKNIGIGNTKSGQYRNAKQILKIVDIFNLIHRDNSKIEIAIKKMQKGEIDGLFYTAGWPTKAINQLTNSINCRFISLDDKLINKMCKEYPFYVKSYIPFGMYKNLKQNVKTIAVKAMLNTRADMPESLIYAITKLIYENTELMKKYHPKWNSVDLMSSRNGVGIPFHPGSNAYFKNNSISARSKPYSTAPVIGFAKTGTTLEIFRDRWNMYQVKLIDGSMGWVKKSVIKNTQKSVIDGCIVTADQLNFRNSPGISNDNHIGVLFKSEIVQKIDSQNDKSGILWYKLRRESGLIGWASSKYLSHKTINGFSGEVIMNNYKTPLQKEAETKWLKKYVW